MGMDIPGPSKVMESPASGSVAQTWNLIVSGPQKDLDESGAVTTGGEFMVIVQVAVS